MVLVLVSVVPVITSVISSPLTRAICSVRGEELLEWKETVNVASHSGSKLMNRCTPG